MGLLLQPRLHWRSRGEGGGEGLDCHAYAGVFGFITRHGGIALESLYYLRCTITIGLGVFSLFIQ